METELPSERSIWLWDDEASAAAGDGFRPWLDPYPVPTGRPCGAVLICPGGGYGGRAYHEGILVAQRFNQAGFHAFVVHYSVAPRRHPVPLCDASRALRLMRQGASRWSVSPEHIAICGFSAGGHLAGSLGTHFDRPYLQDPEAPGRFANRPDALILCYPVISSGPVGHQGSFANLLGPEATAAARYDLSLEQQVSAQTPPAFLWHTVADEGVPVENSLLFAQALRGHGVPFELHVYPRGQHGLGLAAEDPHVATWMELCCEWLRGMGWPAAGQE
jgi:acetyl esterase/lipase